MNCRHHLGFLLLLATCQSSCKTAGDGSGLRSDDAAAGEPQLAKLDAFGDNETISMDRLKATAFNMCQGKFTMPNPVDVPVLDPPKHGSPGEVGLVYQEELAISAKEVYKANDFFFVPKPRAAVNKIPMLVYVSRDAGKTYQKLAWDSVEWNYTNPSIQPPIAANNNIDTLKAAIPDPGQVLTELLVGKCRQTNGKWDCPSLFDLRSSAYVRFAGFPPEVTGASLRLGAHRVFGRGQGESSAKEDFPVLRAVFTAIKSDQTSSAMALLEGDQFCTAINMDMNNDAHANIVVDTYTYARSNFDWKKDPNTGLAAYSSMMWKMQADTPNDANDEAHDSDTFRVTYVDGSEDHEDLSAPQGVLHMTDFSKNQIVAWSLANEHRDPWRFEHFQPALGAYNYNARVSYRVEILESSIRTGARVYLAAADGEYGDNIVALASVREDIRKSASAEDFVHFKYKTSSYYPPWNPKDDAPNTSSCGDPTRICRVPAHDAAMAAEPDSSAETIEECQKSQGKIIGEGNSASCVCADGSPVAGGQACKNGKIDPATDKPLPLPELRRGGSPTPVQPG